MPRARVRAARPAPPRARPPQPPSPLDRRITFAFDGTPLPDVLTAVERETGVAVSVSPTIPAQDWSRHRVTLRMADVTLRAFLDWLVRPLRAEYAIEAQGGVWLTRGDDLLLSEPMDVRAYRVPTHLQTTVPLRGALDFRREQTLILNVLHRCLRYLEDRRPECRLAFHADDDVLVAQLSPRGHKRLGELLDAIRHGSDPPEPPRPSAVELRARLNAPVECDWPPGPAARVLAEIAERSGVNFGWDAPALAAASRDTPVVALPQGTWKLHELLDAVVRQTALGQYQVEPGHGIWFHPEGQDVDPPVSRATLWDRAHVRAYDIAPLLGVRTAQSIVEEVQKLVDPGDWERGLPAAAIFVPTGRLIVVHDEDGHRRMATVVRALIEAAGGPAPERKK